MMGLKEMFRGMGTLVHPAYVGSGCVYGISFDYSECVLGTLQAVDGRSCPVCFRCPVCAAFGNNIVLSHTCFVEVGLVFMQNLLVSPLPCICIAAVSSGFIPEALPLYL